jgi:hypothetical protein
VFITIISVFITFIFIISFVFFRVLPIAWVGHGVDGFGNRGHTAEELAHHKAAVQSEHAANALIRLVDGDVHLIALGTR